MIIIFGLIAAALISSIIAYLFYSGLTNNNYAQLSLGIGLLIFNFLVNIYGIRNNLEEILDKL